MTTIIKLLFYYTMAFGMMSASAGVRHHHHGRGGDHLWPSGEHGHLRETNDQSFKQGRWIWFYFNTTKAPSLPDSNSSSAPAAVEARRVRRDILDSYVYKDLMASAERKAEEPLTLSLSEGERSCMSWLSSEDIDSIMWRR